jgi:hypothetical protein
MDWTHNVWVIGIGTGVASAVIANWLRKLSVTLRKEHQKERKEREERELRRRLNVPESPRRR